MGFTSGLPVVHSSDAICFRKAEKGWFLIRILLAAVCLLAVHVGGPPAVKAAPARAFEIAGTPMECRDFRGREVRSQEVTNLGDVARVWVVNTMPYILIDPEVLRTLPKPLQIFFFFHECAHHTLGHWYNRTLDSENEADCWAIRYGRDNGYFRRQTVVDFRPWLAKSGGSAFGHLPGDKRWKRMLGCFDGVVETAKQ